ncbi:developmental pluripotency-associated protein 2-like [Perognathus longimembris pacificus]|uniref:developmental pluripotency-associated protein 2-like n=1 Tax=Perognathus longimembris pacificus TaxID=214514 RepID=UPI0020185804|nr:developmental pluripotency-associated protein 2-like [Perognathus longimembris pacificus]
MIQGGKTLSVTEGGQVTDEPFEEVVESNVSTSDNINLETPGNNNTDLLPQTNDVKKLSKTHWKKSVCPLPAVLPPIDEVSRDHLRSWCQQFNLSTDGQKIEVYLRLLRHRYPEQQNYIPKTPEEARLTSNSKKHRKERSLQTNSRISEATSHKATVGHERNNIMEVVTSAQASMLACWARIAAGAAKPRTVKFCPTASTIETFLLPASGVRWCVVHGRLLPADGKGWVRLQFCAGQTWVPNSCKTMISLFLLPACLFPTPGLKDNMLCPECVKRNKKIMKKIKYNRR